MIDTTDTEPVLVLLNWSSWNCFRASVASLTSCAAGIFETVRLHGKHPRPRCRSIYPPSDRHSQITTRFTVYRDGESLAARAHRFPMLNNPHI